MAIISFLITVYNQKDIVKENLDVFHNSKNNDFQVVVNDDNSIDDIKGLVDGYNDSRFIYYKNPTNYGHDLNIITGLSHCNTKYAMVLRSRDYMLGDKIDTLIDDLKNDDGKTSYFLYSAIDEKGKHKLRLSDTVYSNDLDRAKAHMELLIHPSGSIYQVKDLNLDLYAKYIKKYFPNSVYGFCVHNLIRMDLAVGKHNFVTSSKIVWLYTNTDKTKDVAQNSTKNKMCVYDPRLIYPRLECEYMFAKESFNNEKGGGIRDIYEHYVIKKYYQSCTIDFVMINKDKRMQKHYNYDEIKFNPYKEHKIFVDTVSKYCTLPDFDKFVKVLKFKILIIKGNIRPAWRLFKSIVKKILGR